MFDYNQIRNFYDRHRSDHSDDPDFLRGTIETSKGIVRFRNRAEARHLSRVLQVERGQRVLDLGAGTGRWSIFFAERGAQVTAIELAPSLAAGAANNARSRGLPLDCRVGSIIDPPLKADESFDIIHIGNVLLYIHDADLARVRDVVNSHIAPNGLLVVREPVDPHGPSERHEDGYSAVYRRPEIYVQLFADEFRLLYERTSVSHLIPRGKSTQSVVTDLRSARWKKPLVEHVLPLVGYVDYELLQIEEFLRSSPLRGILGDSGIVLRFYIFKRGR